MGERGQATVEWVGLVLGIALIFGALLSGGREAARGDSAHELGEAVAERITCAARGACAAGRPGTVAPLHGRPRPPAPPRQSKLSRAAPALRGGSGFLRRAWLLCLGYRRLQYDREHPPTPDVPLRDTAKMLNECVNPLSFLFG